MRPEPRPSGTILPISTGRKRGPTSVRGIWLRDDGICWICLEFVPWEATRKSLLPTRDHVVRIADGGLSTPDNLRLAHLGCNTSRHGIDPATFPAWIRGMLAQEPAALLVRSPHTSPHPIFHGDIRSSGGYQASSPIQAGRAGGFARVEAAVVGRLPARQPARRGLVYEVRDGALMISAPRSAA